jgi:hypothetical protein
MLSILIHSPNEINERQLKPLFNRYIAFDCVVNEIYRCQLLSNS